MWVYLIHFVCGFRPVWRLESSVNSTKTGKYKSCQVHWYKQALRHQSQDPLSSTLRQRIIFTSHIHTSTRIQTHTLEMLWEEVDSGLCVQLRLLSKVKGLWWLTSQKGKRVWLFPLLTFNTSSGWCWIKQWVCEQKINLVKEHNTISLGYSCIILYRWTCLHSQMMMMM